MRKKLLKNLMLTVVMVVLCMVMAMTASAETYSGECGLEGDNLTWTFDTETGVLTIDGEGEMDNYTLYNNINKTSAPWWDYYSQMTELVIGDKVTSIGNRAFHNCDVLTNLDIPESVKSIGFSAFYDCNNIVDVKFNEGLTSIGTYTFYQCDSLKEIVLPDSLISIGEWSFAYCDEVKNIKLGNGLTEIPSRAFSNCRRLNNIEWGTNLKIISDFAFAYCHYNDTGYNYGNIVIPNGVESIYDNAFTVSDSSKIVNSVSIPLSVKIIGQEAFQHFAYKIKDVYYEGTIEQWEAIDIRWNNDGLRTATFHFDHAHSYTSEITTAPTCLATGIKTYTCECGETYTRTLSALGHDIVTEPAVSATCTETGLTEGEYCTRCDYKIEQTETPSLGHDMISFEASEPTCTETGLTAGVACSRCDEISEGRQETVPALGHDIVIDSAVSATCTETGLTEGKHCTRCYYRVSQKITPALGHTETFTEYVEATCTETGLSTGKVCSVCSEVIIPQQVIPAKGHSYTGWITTSEATCEANGKKIKLCSCGIFEEETIPAIGHSDTDNDCKCDKCNCSLKEKTEAPAENDNVFSFLKSFLNNLLDFFRKIFGIK